MGLDANEIGIYVKKGVIFSMRAFYRSAYDHPFVLGMLFYSFLLYRFLPSVFAFLVSSSPVLFCTAVLLGILLSCGNPNIPEIEEEEKNHEISSLIAAHIAEDLVVEKDENTAVETRVERRREIADKAIEEAGLSREDVVVTKVEKGTISSMAHDMGEGMDEDLSSQSTVIEGAEEEDHGEKEEIQERVDRGGGFYDKQEFHEKLIETISKAGEHVEFCHYDDQKKENEGPADGTLTTLTGNRVDYSLGHGEFDSDSDSDCEESSSDASMADITLMLDELHPLLDSEASQFTRIPLDDSDAIFQGSSHESDYGSSESAEAAENREETHEGQEDKIEVVTWTEDDQTNLMDLGTSELERNQWLENLIAKRISRKHQRIAIEKNLIDLDSNDIVHTTLAMSGGLDHIQIQVPPISKVRHNPFDFRYDSNEIAGLPPVTGSGPSVLLPRRNPFDLPYDPANERRNLTGETSSHQGEFIPVQQLEMYFHRHESFTPFSLERKQDKHDIKLKPYFVAEQVASGEASQATFQRQLSEMSDSKISSILDTEMASSIAEKDQDQMLVQESHQESEVISPIEPCAESVDQESESSEEVEPIEIEREKSDIDFGDVHEVYLHASEIIEEALHGDSDGRETSSCTFVVDEESIPSPGRPYVSEVNEKLEVAVENYKELSSSSSPEAKEKIFEMNTDKELGNIGQIMCDSLKGSGEYVKSPHVEAVDGGRVEGPVYDSSPSGIGKSFSNRTNIVGDFFSVDKKVFNYTSSIAFDTHIEIQERSVPPTSVERSFSPRIVKSIPDNISVEKEVASGNEVSWAASLSLSVIEENKLQSRELMEIIEHGAIQFKHSEVHQNDDDSVESMIPKSVIEKVSQDFSSSSWETKLTESLMNEKVNQQFEEVPIFSSTFGKELYVGGPQLDMEGKLDTATVRYSDGLLLSDALQKAQLLIKEPEVLPSSEVNYKETQDLSSIQMKYTGEVNDGNNAQKLVQQPEDGVSLKEMEGSMEYSSILKSEVIEHNSTTDSVDLENDILDRLQSDEEVYVKLITEHIEEAEKIEETNKRLLLELDSVGDCIVEELRSPGKHLKSDEQFNKQMDVNILKDSLIQVEIRKRLPEQQLCEAVEFQLSANQSKLMESEVGYVAFELVQRDLDMKERSSELDVLEAASVTDIDLAFKQHHEGETEKLVFLELIDDKALSTAGEVGYTQFELEKRDLEMREIHSALQVLEARSLEDIDSTFKQFCEGDFENSMFVEPIDDELEELESGVGFVESFPDKNDLEPSETHSDLYVLNGRSLKDVDTGFKQLHERVHEKSDSLESVDNEPKPVEFKIGSAETALGKKHSELIEIHSDKHVLEARCLEDTDSVVEQSHEVDAEFEFSEFTSDKKQFKPMEIHSELLVLEARSTKDINLAFKEMHEGKVEKYLSIELVEEKPLFLEFEVRTTDSANSPLERKHTKAIEIHSDMHVLDARSLENIDSSFKQLQDRGNEKSVSLALINNKNQLVESEIESAEFAARKKISDPIEIYSDLIEARSLEDNDSVFKQHHGGLGKSASFELVDEKPKPLESEVWSAEYMPDKKHLEPNDIYSDRQASEVRSLEDIDLNFEQLHGDLKKSITLESVDDRMELVETEVGSSKSASDEKDSEPIETNSSLQVPIARSIEVIHLDPKQVSGGNVEDPLKPIESNDEPADFKAIESHLEPIILMRSAEEIEAALKEFVVKESDTSTEELDSAKSNKGIKETSDGSSSRSSATRERCKKAGSGKSSLSSSSISSDSD